MDFIVGTVLVFVALGAVAVCAAAAVWIIGVTLWPILGVLVEALTALPHVVTLIRRRLRTRSARARAHPVR